MISRPCATLSVNGDIDGFWQFLRKEKGKTKTARKRLNHNTMQLRLLEWLSSSRGGYLSLFLLCCQIEPFFSNWVVFCSFISLGNAFANCIVVANCVHSVMNLHLSVDNMWPTNRVKMFCVVFLLSRSCLCGWMTKWCFSFCPERHNTAARSIQTWE